MRFDLSSLAGHEMAELGARIRRCGDDRASDFATVAQAIADTMWESVTETTPPMLALVRVYRARGGVLERVAARAMAPESDDAPPLVGLAEVVAGGAVFVADAIGSERVLPQRDFVLRYGVRSVIAIGGPLPPDDGFALVVYTRVTLTDEVAASFASVGLNAGIALGRATDAPTGAEASEARAEALDRLLRLEEFVLVKRVVEQQRDLEQLRSERERTARESIAAAQARIQLQERGQRAMLNVIEDLREARTELERRVDDRTRELVRANDELRVSNGELEQFAYVASHDLQEPLRTIAGYLQMLEERHGHRLDGDAHEFVAYAVQGAHRMQELIEALLQYSRVSRAPISVDEVALDGALDDALAALGKAIGESQAHLLRDALPVVRGDRVLLRQLFQNLLSNAIKFAGSAPPRIEVSAEKSDNTVVLRVRDHGIGFDPKYSEQIFKVFRRLQRKLPGTGIGLAICRKIVERHGGTIEASALPGAGATFQVTLPGGVS